MATPASSVSNKPIQLDDLIAAASKKEATATDYVNLSEAYVQRRKFHSAIGALKGAVEINKTSIRTLKDQAEIYFKSGKNAEARNCLERVLEIDKMSIPILRRQAEVYFQSGKYAKARDLWCEAVCQAAIPAKEGSDLWRDAINISRASHLLGDLSNTSLWLKNAQNKAPHTEEAKQEIEKLNQFLNSKAYTETI